MALSELSLGLSFLPLSMAMICMLAMVLKQNLLRRGYKQEKLEQQIQKATTITREEALRPQEQKEEHRVPLVTNYHPRQAPISHITQKHHHIFHLSEGLKKAVSDPSLIAH